VETVHTADVLMTFVAVAVAYALGCIVGAYYVVRLRAGHDVRSTGSGNAGTRNVLRSGDRTSAALTLLVDLVKGALAVWLAQLIAPGELVTASAAVAVVAGHIWPVQLQFRGGKGVAAAIGATLAANPIGALAGGSWMPLAGAGLAWVIVFVMHQPSVARRRAVPPAVRQEKIS
jgi:acyl phosphate:glycerol-3-phosphate acyltransferase